MSSQMNRTYTIMETSKLSGLPESTLRYYETIGLIYPIARDMSSKHRVYTEDDINVVIAVACLSATGMSLDDMREYLSNRSRGAEAANEQISLLDHQRRRLLEEAHFMELRQRYIEVKIGYWKAVEAGDETKIEETKQLADSIASQLKLPKEKIK